MTVNWTESALADLRAIEEYLNRHSPRYASSLIARIFDRTEPLEGEPRTGARVEEYVEDSLRELFEDPYRIIYRILPDRIDVVAVVHSARKLPRGL